MFNYKDAIRCYDMLIGYAEKRGMDQLKNAYYYTEVAKIILNDGNYEKALEYTQKIIDVRREILNPNHFDIAVAYNNIGVSIPSKFH